MALLLLRDRRPTSFPDDGRLPAGCEYALELHENRRRDSAVVPGALGKIGARTPGSDRKSTRLNSSHRCISYAVFCLKKKKIMKMNTIIKKNTIHYLIFI